MAKKYLKNTRFCKKFFLNPLTNGLEYAIIMAYKRYCIVFQKKKLGCVPAMPVFRATNG